MYDKNSQRLIHQFYKSTNASRQGVKLYNLATFTQYTYYMNIYGSELESEYIYHMAQNHITELTIT